MPDKAPEPEPAPDKDTKPAPAPADKAPAPKPIGAPAGKPRVPGSGPLPKATSLDVGRATHVDDAFRNRDAKAPENIDKNARVTTGNKYADKGAVCDNDEERETCFMEHGQRHRLISQIVSLLGLAAPNYQTALQVIRPLFEKAEDLNWVVKLALDALSGQFSKALEASLPLLMDDIQDGPRMTAALNRIAPEVTKASIKAAVARESTAKANKGEASKSYIEMLSDQAHASFARLKTDVPASATDAELHWIWKTLEDSSTYSVSAFTAALKEKVDRYHAAGISKIGKTHAESGRVARNTRVIEIHYTSGHPKEVWLEKWDMAAQIQNGEDMGSRDYEPSAPTTKAPELVSRVPDEFLEAAKARQAQKWGHDVTAYRVIDESEHDPIVYGKERHAKALAHKRSLARPARPAVDLHEPTSFGQTKVPTIPATGPIGSRYPS